MIRMLRKSHKLPEQTENHSFICRRHGVGSLVALLVLTLGSASHAADPPSVKVDSTPLKREIKAATSYAPMLKEVSQGVVNIFTVTRMETPQRNPGTDELFRYFFGPRFDDSMNGGNRSRKESSLGSGVIVSADGYILTNNHVVNEVDEIRVVIPEVSKEYSATLVGTDPATEVAVLKIDADNLKPVTLGESNLLEVGDTVIAIGNPFGVGQTVTSGIISALGRGFDQGISIYEDFIQTDASINPGNSGGALLDVQGRLVGINTAIISNTYGNQGIGLAIPINLAKSVMNQLVTKGKVSRGFLGVMPQAVDADLAQIFELPDTSGAIIAKVEKNTPAAQAGLKVEDVIVEIDGKKIRDDEHLRLVVSQFPPGTSIKVKAIREGKPLEVDVVLAELDRSALASSMPESSDQVAEGKNALAGVELKDLVDIPASQLPVRDLEGAIISSIDPSCAAYDAGLRRGYIILNIDGVDIESAAEANGAARTEKDKVLVRVWLSNGNIRLMVIDLTE